MAKCPYEDCKSHIDCVIIDITGKIPKTKDKCSYYEKEVIKKAEKLKKGE
jgi:hypothetical protein